MPCKLFSCPYLSKRGIGYYPREFLLLKCFLNQKQRHEIVFDFWKTKEKIIQKFSLFLHIQDTEPLNPERKHWYQFEQIFLLALKALIIACRL